MKFDFFKITDEVEEQAIEITYEKCPFCERDFGSDTIETHKTLCEKNPENITLKKTVPKEIKPKEICSYCGKEYRNVESHQKKCPDNPENLKEVVPQEINEIFKYIAESTEFRRLMYLIIKLETHRGKTAGVSQALSKFYKKVKK